MGLEVALAIGAAAVSVFGALVFAVERRSRRQRISRGLRRAPLRAIADLQDGELVKIVGKARPVGELVRAPLTGKSCIYSRTIIDKSSSMDGIEDTRCGDQIWIEDATGRALVQMDDPPPLAVLYPRISGGRMGQPTARESALFHQHSIYIHPNVGAEYYFREGYVESSDEIVVAGVCRISQIQGYRDAPPRARIIAPPGARLLLSDLPEHVEAARRQQG